MFTGLIETIGEVREIVSNDLGARLTFSTDFKDNDVKLGDSIAVNGVCLTVSRIENNNCYTNVMNETLKLSNLKNLKKGDKINLERAMKANSRFDGHIVSGHIDNIAVVKKITDDGFSKRVEFNCDNNLIILKGSICINGVSLTVSNLTDNGFEISLIPTTINNTNLKNLKLGDIVNIEYDLIGKYIKKFLKANEKKDISIDFLKENGFY